MYKYLISFLLILSIFIITSCNTGNNNPDNKIEIKLGPEEGKIYNLYIMADQKVSVEGQGSMEQAVGIGYEFNIEKIDEKGNIRAAVTWSSLYYKQEGGLQEDIEYDSKNPPGEIPLQAKGFAFMAGKSFKMEITPEGKVENIEGPDELVEEAIEKTEISDETEKEVFEESMKCHFGSDALGEMMESYFNIYPENPVKTGDSWTEENKISTGFPMLINNDWKFISRETGLVKLELDGKISSNPDGFPVQIGPCLFDFEVTSGKQKGTVEIDEKTGWIKSGTLVQNISGNIGMGEVIVESNITYDNK